MRNSKAVGVDVITIELIKKKKTVGEKGKLKYCYSATQCMHQENGQPMFFLETVILSLEKSKNAGSCEDYRTNSPFTSTNFEQKIIRKDECAKLKWNSLDFEDETAKLLVGKEQ